MRVSLCLIALALQLCLVESQATDSSGRRRATRRKPTTPESTTSLLPDFIRRAFGRGSTSDTTTSSGRMTRRPQAGANRKLSRRPGAGGPQSLANLAGSGPFPRRRMTMVNGTRMEIIPHRTVVMTPASREALSDAPLFTPDGLPILPQSSLGIAPQFDLESSSLSAVATPPESLDGWLPHPKEAPTVTPTKRTPILANKSGVCGDELSYGIKCRERMDQCISDTTCPGSTRCCMVGECGYLCVKPKASFDSPKKRWGGASSVLKRQREEEEEVHESSTTAAGLKLDDITVHNDLKTKSRQS